MITVDDDANKLGYALTEFVKLEITKRNAKKDEKLIALFEVLKRVEVQTGLKIVYIEQRLTSIGIRAFDKHDPNWRKLVRIMEQQENWS